MQCFEAELDNLQKNIKGGMVKKSQRRLASHKSTAGGAASHEQGPSRTHASNTGAISTLVIKDRVKIEVTQGDITEEDTDVIVNSTDDMLGMSAFIFIYVLEMGYL